MKFEIKRTRGKKACIYKTIYIKKEVSEQIEIIAIEHHTSFNNVVVSMIDACLSDTSQSASLTAPLKGSLLGVRSRS